MPAGKSDPSTKRHRIIRKKQSERFSRYFLLTILIGVTVLFFKMVSIFLLPVVLAAVFTTLFYPFYNYLVKLLRQHRAIAALLCCLLLFTCLLIPLYIAGNLITHQAIQFYQSIQKNVNQALQDGQPGPLNRLKESAIVRSLHLENLNWDSIVKDA